MRARSSNLLPWIGIVAGGETVLGALYGWTQFLRGGSLRLGHGFPDFFIYAAMGRQLRADGFAGAYDLTVQKHFQDQVTGVHASLLPFIAPPYALPLWLPFGYLDLHTGYIVWALITAALLAAAIAILVRTSSLTGVRAWAAALLAAAWLPLLVTVLQGQTTGVVLLGLALAASVWANQREVPAGAGAVLTLLRPHVVLAVPGLFLLKSWRRALAALIAASAIVCLATLPLVGIGTWRAYLALVAPWLIHGRTLGFEQDSYSLRGLLAQAAVPGVALIVVEVAAAALVLWALWRGPDRMLAFALAAVASVVLSPYQNLHDLSLAVVAVILLAGALIAGRVRRPALGWTALGAMYVGVDAALVATPAAPIGMLVLCAFLAWELLSPAA